MSILHFSKIQQNHLKHFSLKKQGVVVFFRLDNKSHGRASMSSEPKVGPESDTDSMAEYGDGDTGMYFMVASDSI